MTRFPTNAKKINSEAQLHELKEYMNHVDRYYEYLEAERLLMARKEVGSYLANPDGELTIQFVILLNSVMI